MDYNYWNEYYKSNNTSKEPSDFAKYSFTYMKNDKTLLELGCGNGRDAIFFSSKGLKVTAIDQSDISINILNETTDNITFVADNFIESDYIKNHNYDYIYSRFTMHSITEDEENVLINRIYKSLNKDGLFFMEARSVKDEIFGLGEKVDKNTYIYNNHSRRFLVFDEILQKLKNIGFEIIYCDENNNYAVYKEQNPVVIRVVAKK